MLHEGLGCVGLWGDFPDKIQAAAGAGVFVYSRAGYGQSSPAKLPRQPDYMHAEALDVLPKILDAIGFRRGLLLGHSDGASIATIYAGGIQDHRVRGLILIAPHFVVEDVSLKQHTHPGVGRKLPFHVAVIAWGQKGIDDHDQQRPKRREEDDQQRRRGKQPARADIVAFGLVGDLFRGRHELILQQLRGGVADLNADLVAGFEAAAGKT